MRNKCSGCQQEFYSVAAFDNHRTGSYGKAIYDEVTGNKVIGHTPSERRCLTADEMRAQEMHQDDKGIWHNPAGDNYWTAQKETPEES